MPMDSEPRALPALMTTPHGRMLAPGSWQLEQVAIESSARNGLAGSIQEALHSFSRIGHVLWEN